MSETCDAADQVNAESSAGHWVEDLFPPTFRLSLQQLVHGSITTAVLDRHGCDLPAESEPGCSSEELFAKRARGISLPDVETIKNVYQRVWLMMQEASAAARSKLLYYIQSYSLHNGVPLITHAGYIAADVG